MGNELSEFSKKVRAFMGRSLLSGSDGDQFEALALELHRLQRRFNPAYDRLCAIRNVAEVVRLSDIPAVPTVAFKELEMTSLPVPERQTVFYSSGTTQKDRSRHFHSAESLTVYEESLLLWFNQHFPGADFDWVFLTPPSKDAPNSSLVHMFQFIADIRAPKPAVFAGHVDQTGGWSLDCAEVRDALKASKPIALLGTAFLFVRLCDELEQANVRFQLPAGSWIMETGGYKGRSREMPKDELRKHLTQLLGIPPNRIFGEYGMSELCSQAYDAADGVFRFPPWARAQIISPATGREVNQGERGLIRLIDLANIWSVMAVQTEDLGRQHKNGFELCGRAAQAEARGCSLMSV